MQIETWEAPIIFRVGVAKALHDPIQFFSRYCHGLFSLQNFQMISEKQRFDYAKVLRRKINACGLRFWL